MPVELPPRRRQIIPHRLDRTPPQRHHPLLELFPQTPREPRVSRLHVVHLQARRLRHPRPRRVHHLQNRTVTHSQPLLRIRRREQRLYVVHTLSRSPAAAATGAAIAEPTPRSSRSSLDRQEPEQHPRTATSSRVTEFADCPRAFLVRQEPQDRPRPRTVSNPGEPRVFRYPQKRPGRLPDARIGFSASPHSTARDPGNASTSSSMSISHWSVVIGQRPGLASGWCWQPARARLFQLHRRHPQ